MNLSLKDLVIIGVAIFFVIIALLILFGGQVSDLIGSVGILLIVGATIIMAGFMFILSNQIIDFVGKKK